LELHADAKVLKLACFIFLTEQTEVRIGYDFEPILTTKKTKTTGRLNGKLTLDIKQPENKKIKNR